MHGDTPIEPAHRPDPAPPPDLRLPAYQAQLEAYHRAFAGELRAILAALPLPPGARVLDVACGDGTYALWLAEYAGEEGHVTGVDALPDYLRLAAWRAAASPVAARVRFEPGTIERLPFPDDHFDLVWCAQSLYSLPEPLAALREMARVARPGGAVAVLENDTLHHLLLPWPAWLELAARQAELDALSGEADCPLQAGCPEKYYIGRHLPPVFRAAGLAGCRSKSYVFDRQAPLGADERTFLAGVLENLWGRVRGRLAPDARQALEALVDPASGRYLLDALDFFMTCLNIVSWGIKPGGAQ